MLDKTVCFGHFGLRGPEHWDPWGSLFAWDCFLPVTSVGRHLEAGSWCRSEVVVDPAGRGTFRVYWPAPDLLSDYPGMDDYEEVVVILCVDVDKSVSL